VKAIVQNVARREFGHGGRHGRGPRLSCRKPSESDL